MAWNPPYLKVKNHFDQLGPNQIQGSINAINAKFGDGFHEFHEYIKDVNSLKSFEI